MPQPMTYVIPEQAFDLTLLPERAREIGSDAFRQQVTKYLRAQHGADAGATSVEFVDGNIVVTWIPEEIDSEPMDAIIDLLNAGDYAQAAPMLEDLLHANPNDVVALYNLGMVYSDQGRLGEAQDLLRRATRAAPDHTNAWTALGVAASRANDRQGARTALERALELAPDNPYALRTLGTVHAQNGEYGEAIRLLRSALTAAPDDPLTLLALGQALLGNGPETDAGEADRLLSRVLDIAPHGAVAEQAASIRRQISNRQFRSAAAGNLRPDAVLYCLDALRRYEGMTQEELGPIVMEMATLGQSGLSVNDSAKRYTLRLTPGEFSGLEVVCMMHVGLKKLMPEASSGMDIDDEYQAALATFERERGSGQG